MNRNNEFVQNKYQKQPYLTAKFKNNFNPLEKLDKLIRMNRNNEFVEKHVNP
jgi:hypothetical protein